MRHNRSRDNRGAAMIGLCLVLFLVLTFIAFFVFDMNRMQMAQRQLTAVCNSAALGGSAMLTAQDISYENSSLYSLQQDQLAAMLYAKNSFCMGYLLGHELYDSALGTQTNCIPVYQVNSSWQMMTPAAGAVNVLIQLSSPINNYSVVQAGNSTGRAINVQAAYGYVPFLSSLGIPSVVLPAQSTGGLQRLLVVMVFDVSGSMDDDTVVSFVERRWSNATDSAAIKTANSGQGEYVYQVVGSPGATGQLWEYSGFNYVSEPNGTALNVLPPQNLTYTGTMYNGTFTAPPSSVNPFSNVTPPLAFDFAIRSYVAWPGQAASNPYYNSVNNTSSYYYPTTHAATGNGAGGSTTAGILGNFTGPVYDNDFGTPPGNCPIKYGATAQVPGGVAGIIAAINPAGITNVWSSYGTANQWLQLPEYLYSPGFYYYPDPNGPQSNSPVNDGNVYFFDPYSMPQPYSGSSYNAYTDLVVNITSVTSPQSQPLYGSSPFTGFSYTFPSTSYNVGFAEGYSSYSDKVSYESDPDLTGKTFAFPSIAYVVEAARGNLDYDNSNKGTNFVNALLLYGNNLGDDGTTMQAACRTGYQKAYQRLAMYCSQPYATAVDGAYRFMQNLQQISNTVFGFTAFSVSPLDTTYAPKYGTANDSSLWLNTPSNPPSSAAVYAPFIWQGVPGLINPNFWMWSPLTLGKAGPAGSPTQIPYSASYNTNGPNGTTWLSISSTGAPSGSGSGSLAGSGAGPSANSNTPSWGFVNYGFQIPRSPLPIGGGGDLYSETSTQAYYSFAQCCAPGMWSSYDYSNTGSSFPSGGYHGLFHCRPLYGTEGLEALNNAYTQLTDYSGPSIGFYGTTPGPGAKGAVIFFTDGVPTDDNSPFPTYTTYAKAFSAVGVPVYAVGIALNSTIQSQQALFLQNLTNNGAYGSQYFQVSAEANLLSSFTAIARQLAQCQR